MNLDETVSRESRARRMFGDVEVRSRLYALSLWLVVTAMVISLVQHETTFGNVYVVALLAGVALVAERGQVQLSSGLSESVSLVPILFGAVLFGPLAAMVVAAASVLLEFKTPYLRWASYTASRAVTAGVTGLIAQAIHGAIPAELTAVGVATVVGAIVSQSLDAGFASLALRLRRRAGLGETLRAIGPLALAAVPLYAPIVGFLAFSYERISPLTLPLFFVPGLAAQRLFALYQDQRRLTEELVSANETLERANLSFASALVVTLDARDRYTAGHSAAVAVYARDIARRLDLSDEQQQVAYVAGLVHDIGKIGLSAGLLEKPGALTLDERREMQRHSEIGERILSNVETYSEIASIVRHHHERVDGGGYPDALVSDEIPFISRIIGVADAYNAMTSDRPYRDAMPSRVARLRLAQAADTQFDTTVIAAFEAVLAGATERYRTADFIKGIRVSFDKDTVQQQVLAQLNA
jgi:putative nucleotidyltransferase with HDIG domain